MRRRTWIVILIVRYVLVFLGAWQLDILTSPWAWALRDERFYFWFWDLSVWDAFALFFWTLGLGAFVPEIVFVARWIRSFANKTKES